MTSFVGMNKYNEIALNRHLSVGGLRSNGTLMNAVLHNGFYTNFQGCYMSEVVTATPGPTYSRLGIDADLNPYRVIGTSQMMTIRGSNTTIVAGAGFPDATTTSTTGVMRLTNNDTGTGVNGKAAMVMHQENALWISPASNFTAIFDIAQWTQRTLGITQAFSEFGLVGTCTASDLIDAVKVPGYVDGTNDKVSCYVKLYGNQGRLNIVSADLAALQTSAAFEIPAGAFTARLEYGAAVSNGSPGVALFINDRFVVSVATSLTGSMQLFARACHGAAYIAASMTPAILDVDAIAVALS